MSGVDLSAAALEQARALAVRTGADIDYHQADVSQPAAVLDAVGAGGHDLVYTGIGALCWLPDITRWAQLVATCSHPAVGCSSATPTRRC